MNDVAEWLEEGSLGFKFRQASHVGITNCVEFILAEHKLIERVQRM